MKFQVGDIVKFKKWHNSYGLIVDIRKIKAGNRYTNTLNYRCYDFQDKHIYGFYDFNLELVK